MAILTYGNKEKRYGIAEQSVWGTAELDSATFLELACEATTINRDVKHRMSNQSHGTRFDIATEAVNDVKRCAPTISLKGVAKQDEVDHFINAFFQSVTEGATTPFSKTFTIATGQPDFSASAGHFLTVIERIPIASKSVKMTDCIASGLKLSSAPGEMMMYEVELVGRGTVGETSNPSGTWTIEGNDYWYTEDMDRYTWNPSGGATDMHLSPDAGWEISMTQDVVLIGADGSGNCETFGLANRKGEFTINALDDGTVATNLMSHYRGSGQLNFNISWGNVTPGTDDADFDIAFTGRLTNAVRDNADILGVTATGIMLGTNASTTPITIIMANAEDRVW